MSGQIDEIIAVAQRYVGIKEAPPGSNNVIFNTRYYGKPVSGGAYPWCCAFIWCLFQDIGAPELFYGGNKTASCTTLMNYAKSNILFAPSGFRRGDLALFNFDDNKNTSEHVGLITAVSGSSVQTIEGNTSMSNNSNGGEVMRRVRVCSTIVGVYRPKYKEDVEMTQQEYEAMYNSVNPLYRSISDVPTYWVKDVEALIKAGKIKGDGTGLNIRHDTLRAVIIATR